MYIDALIEFKREHPGSVKLARRKGDTREWEVVMSGVDKTVVLTYGSTTKNAKVWLHHLTKEAKKKGTLGANSSASSTSIDVKVGVVWVPLGILGLFA